MKWKFVIERNKEAYNISVTNVFKYNDKLFGELSCWQSKAFVEIDLLNNKFTNFNLNLKLNINLTSLKIPKDIKVKILDYVENMNQYTPKGLEFRHNFSQFIETMLDLQVDKEDIVFDLNNDFGCEDKNWQENKHDYNDYDLRDILLMNIENYEWGYDEFFSTFVPYFYDLEEDEIDKNKILELISDMNKPLEMICEQIDCRLKLEEKK